MQVCERLCLQPALPDAVWLLKATACVATSMLTRQGSRGASLP